MNQSIAAIIAEYFATKPVVRAFVFGSFARGENGPGSDIDILVTFDRTAKVSLFDHVSMTYDLEHMLDAIGRIFQFVFGRFFLLTNTPSSPKFPAAGWQRNICRRPFAGCLSHGVRAGRFGRCWGSSWRVFYKMLLR